MSANAVAIKAGGAIAGIVPCNLDEAYRLAQAVSMSGLAPKGMDKPEQVLIAIMTGLEVGLPPMFALNKIAVINGRPTLWGDAIPALLFSKGFQFAERLSGSGLQAVATCTITRPDGSVIERTFSAQDAKTAGLWDKSGPWKQYPTRMLQMRARGFAARDGAADVLGGLYLREEVEDAPAPPKDITPSTFGDALLMPPELPDVAVDPSPEHETEAADDDLLADAEGFLVKLREDRDYCQSETDVAELREANAHLIDRLTEADKARAAQILEIE